MSHQGEFHGKLSVIMVSSTLPASSRDLPGRSVCYPLLRWCPASRKNTFLSWKLESVMGVDYNNNVWCTISCGQTPITEVPCDFPFIAMFFNSNRCPSHFQTLHGFSIHDQSDTIIIIGFLNTGFTLMMLFKKLKIKAVASSSFCMQAY